MLSNPTNRKSLVKDCVELKKKGVTPILIHGGGNEVSQYLKELKIESKFVNGQRYTDSKVIEVVEMVLSGKVNKSIVSEFTQCGNHAIGISGKDAGLVIAKKLNLNGDDLGLVGEVETVNTKLIRDLIEIGLTPVISPICTNNFGETLNVNADYMAMGIASELKCDIIFLTDVDGVYEDFENKESLIYSLNKKQALNKIELGTIKGGMIPKILGCIKCLDQGIKKVYLANGTKVNILQEIVINAKPSGTIITLK